MADALSDAGLVGELNFGGFVGEVHRASIGLTRKELESKSPTLEKVRMQLEWSQAPRGLNFEDQRGELANALLEPFQNRDPDATLRTELERFLVRNFQHPAINAASWLGASPKAREVMLRWLVGTTLEDFFHILDRTASSASLEGNRWRYRKAFWGAYHRKGFIRDAWVAVGPAAGEILRQTRKRAALQYGQLRGATTNDCILLLRIGTMTIAEWSHTGACRFWRAGNRTAPPIYRHSYERDEIVGSQPDEAITHHGSANYNWQTRIADYLREETNAWLSRKEYAL